MPVYEYQCEKCERETEKLQKITDKPLKKCEYCGGKLKRIISRNSFYLKGKGWARDL